MVIPNCKLTVAIIIISILIVGISEGIGSNNISASLSESRSKFCPPGYTIDESGFCSPTNVSPMQVSKNGTISEDASTTSQNKTEQKASRLAQPKPILEPQQQARQFTANLNGDAEVPPVTSSATGTVDFSLHENGDEISYELDVENIEGVLFAHIHQGGEFENAPIVVTLFNASEPTGEVDGTWYPEACHYLGLEQR